MSQPSDYIYKYGLVFGPKGNRIYTEDMPPVSQAIRDALEAHPSVSPSRRNLNHMPDRRP